MLTGRQWKEHCPPNMEGSDVGGVQADHSYPTSITTVPPFPPRIPANHGSVPQNILKSFPIISLLPRSRHRHTLRIPMFSAAVLTVSDTAFANNLLDTSGPAAADFLRGRGYLVPHTAIVPDDTQLIRQSINAWVRDASHPIDLVVTTGGTGFGVRDLTPEVLNPALAVLGILIIDFLSGRVPSN